MTFVPLIEHTRGNLAEVVHAGAIAVVDTLGQLVASAGNAHALTFTRSTLKPFQALPFLQGGGPEQFGLTPPQVALLCASHNGEAMHVTQIDSMLLKIGATHRTLQCGCHVPLMFSYGGHVAPAGLQFDERHNNCSGKHTGFVAHCLQHGLPLDNHLDMARPLAFNSTNATTTAAASTPALWRTVCSTACRLTIIWTWRTRCKWRFVRRLPGLRSVLSLSWQLA